MIDKIFRMIGLCIVACSLSYQGTASSPEEEKAYSPPSNILPPIEELASLEASLALVSTSTVPDESAIKEGEEGQGLASPKAGRRRVVRRKSTKTKEKDKDNAVTTTPRSQGMTVEPASVLALVLSSANSDTKSKFKPSKSDVYFAPREIPSSYLVFILMADQYKDSRAVHSLFCDPNSDLYFGYRDMPQNTLDNLKSALKFDEFVRTTNVQNLMTLCRVGMDKSEDFDKSLTPEDIKKAKELITHIQAEHEAQTLLKVIINESDKRPEINTLGLIIKRDQIVSNLASYMLYRDQGKAFYVSEPKEKSKKKKLESNQNFVEVRLTVAKVTKSEKSTPRKRSGSKTSESPASSSGVSSSSGASTPLDNAPISPRNDVE